MESINELKKRYNDILKRFYKAGDYMDNSNNELRERLKYVNEVRKILDDLNSILKRLRDAGEIVTEKMILEGFDI